MAVFYDNLFFNKYFKYKDLKRFHNSYTMFNQFIEENSIGTLDKRFITKITNEEIKEYIYFEEFLIPEYLSKYNKQMLENIITFYDIMENEKKIENIIKKNKEILTEKLNNVGNEYLKSTDSLKKYNNFTYIKILGIPNEYIFFTKNIIQKWLQEKNNLLEKQNQFFQDENYEDLEVEILFDLYAKEEVARTFSISYKLESNNYSTNKDLIKEKYYNEIDDMEFFDLNDLFEDLKKQNYEENRKKLKFYFGNIYFKLNTTNQFIRNDFENLLNSLGLNIIYLEENNFIPNLNDKKEYCSYSMTQLIQFLLSKS